MVPLEVSPKPRTLPALIASQNTKSLSLLVCFRLPEPGPHQPECFPLSDCETSIIPRVVQNGVYWVTDLNIRIQKFRLKSNIYFHWFSFVLMCSLLCSALHVSDLLLFHTCEATLEAPEHQQYSLRSTMSHLRFH